MFNFLELKQVHVELTSMCQASCPMCARNHHGGLPNKNLPIGEITFDQFKIIFNEEVLNQINHVTFCGNYGDPIMSNHLLNILEYCKKINTELSVGIHTNGSARNVNWWKELAKILPINHCVHFALDGLEDTHHLYRIGTNYHKIIENAKGFIDQGGIAEWVFLSFKHNEHQIEEAKNTAASLGFSKFLLKETTRFVEKPWFDVFDKNGETIYKIEPPSTTKLSFIKPEVVKNYKNFIYEAEIQCKVLEDRSIYVDAFKTLWPCCWLGAVPYVYSDPNSISHPYQIDSIESVQQLVAELGGSDFRNLLKNSIKDILNTSIWQEIYANYWEQKKLLTCVKVCGKFSKKIMSQPNEQFLNYENLKK